MKVLKVFLFVFAMTLLSCSSFRNTSSNKISFDEFKILTVGGATVEDVQRVFGPPDNAYHLGKENQIVEKSEKSQWIYKNKDLNKMYLYFESDVLISKSWDVYEKDEESSIEKVLGHLKGDWTVVKEPMTNPHAGPTQCYLEDFKRGKLVKVDGYKKNVSEISVWTPAKNEKSIKESLYRKVGEEFCIANNCSKVTNPEMWKHDHCEWLQKLVADQKKK